MKKLTKWADRQVTESAKPKDANWEEKLKQKLAELNTKLQSALKQFK